MANFIWGANGAQLTPDQVERLRAQSALMGQDARLTSPVASPFAGINRALEGYLGRRNDRRSDASEASGLAGADARIAALLGGGGLNTGGGSMSAPQQPFTPSGTWAPGTPVDPASPQGIAADAMTAIGHLTPQQMVIEGAKARGLDPLDVATAMSYETGGTMDPMQPGPTTQWGQHEGLIQFGEPQRGKYGVDMSSPETAMNSQLNPENGAVWNYLADTGVKPGMGLPEIYSAINAGAVGRMGASDANNGGAPGTVADKVAGMGDHRAQAAEWLGGTWTPNQNAAPRTSVSTMGAPSGGTQGADIASLLALSADPWVAKKYGGVINALMGQQLGQQNAQYSAQLAQQDPRYQLGLQADQLALDQARNGTGGTAVEYGLQPLVTQDADGKYHLFQVAKDGSQPKEIPLPYGWTPKQQFLDTGTGFQGVATQGVLPTGTTVPKDLKGAAEQTAIGTATGAAIVAAPTDMQAGQNALDYIDQIRNSPNIDRGTGWTSYGNSLPGTAGKDFQNLVDQSKSGAFLTAIQSMRGLGSLSNAEGGAATAAVNRMDTATSKGAFLSALDDYEKIIRQGMAKAQKNGAVPAGDPALFGTTTPQGATVPDSLSQQPQLKQYTNDADYDAWPSGTQFVAPDGTTRVKP